MLLEDLATVREIKKAKRLVRARLKSTANWCRPGLWYVLGPYARHHRARLPDSLHDAIHGLVKRRVARSIVERAMPPWHTVIPEPICGTQRRNCTIGYLAKTGDWKLFDLEKDDVWTRSRVPENSYQDIENVKRFRPYFFVPESYTVQQDGTLWRCDTYIHGRKLAQCRSDEREAAFRSLLHQHLVFARCEAREPNLELTRRAIETMRRFAPDSIPGLFVEKRCEQLERLGSNLALLPAHGDLNAQNVIISAGQPWLIDWDAAGELQPVLYDLLSLILWEADLGRFDLLRAFFGGAFDPGVCEVLSLCGLTNPPCDNMLLLVHAYILRFHMLRSANERSAVASNVARLWNAIHIVHGPYFDERAA